MMVWALFLLSAFMVACEPAWPPALPDPTASQVPPVQRPPVPSMRAPAIVLEPKPVFSASYPAEAYGNPSTRLISPTGDYLLCVTAGPDIVALPLRDGLEQKTLYRETPPALSGWPVRSPLGWTTGDKCLFIADRSTSSGPDSTQNQDTRTLSLREGDLATGESREIAGFPLPPGVVKTVTWNRPAGKVFIHTSGSIWEMDIDDGTSRLLRGDLPTWDGLFRAMPSPTGHAFVYNMPLDGANALALLDTTTGAEERIHADDVGWSFYPSWSPDGRYLVAYLAAKKPGVEGPSEQGFDLIPYEDGPYAAAKCLLIYDSQEGSYRTVSARGKWIFRPRWSGDSSHVFFIAGTVEHDTAKFFPESVTVSWESLWSLDIGPNGVAASPTSSAFPEMVADIDSLPPGAQFSLEEVSADGRMAFLNVSEEGRTSVWCLEKERAPREITVGEVSYHAGAVHGPHVVRAVKKGGKTIELWAFGGGSGAENTRAVLTAREVSDLSVVAYNNDLLVLAGKSCVEDVPTVNDTWTYAVYRWSALLP